MNGIRHLLLVTLYFAVAKSAIAQEDNPAQSHHSLDSFYIHEVEDGKTGLCEKVLHAEPLYIDLIRDLGARAGEKEWNIGSGLTDRNKFDTYEGFVEYEWAPINRLGLEVEAPFSISSSRNGYSQDSMPDSKVEGLKTAVQYSFFVDKERSTSLAIGYINELELNNLKSMSQRPLIGNSYAPFFVAAKRWDLNFHTLIYTGPIFTQHFYKKDMEFTYQHNTSLHYMISGTRNFVGLEFNKSFYPSGDFDMTIRPQMRVGFAENLLLGIMTGVPVERENERLSMFLRLIWEPHSKCK